MTTKKLLSDDMAFRLHSLNRNSLNMSLLKYNDFQGFLVTGPHSGTHWVKWMLSHAMAHHYKVAPPKYFNNSSSNDIIGHPKHPQMYPQIPRIASSHAIAPVAMNWGWVRRLRRLPPYVLVVRDIRDVLISNYEKWKETYNVPFSQFLQGDPWGERFITDAYSYTRMLNRWGSVASRAQPGEIVVLRYEDFKNDKITALRKIAEQFRLPLSQEDLEAGAEAGHKDFMAQHHNPENTSKALRPDGVGDTVYSDADKGLLLSILDKHLEHDFGYGFFDKPRGFQVK